MSGYGIQRNRTLFAQKNKMDKCTIVSIYPREIKVKKHTIFPGHFKIPAGEFEHPGLLVVGASSWFKNDYQNMESVEIPTGSVNMAESIIGDWARGLVGISYPAVMPGLFFIEGEYGPMTIKKHEEYIPRLELAKKKQDDWYKVLVEVADVDWARTNGNPRSISDDSRLAAERLGLKDKPWMQDFKTLSLVACPACGHMRNENFPICPNCHTIVDKIQYAKLGLNTPKPETLAVK